MRQIEFSPVLWLLQRAVPCCLLSTINRSINRCFRVLTFFFFFYQDCGRIVLFFFPSREGMAFFFPLLPLVSALPPPPPPLWHLNKGLYLLAPRERGGGRSILKKVGENMGKTRPSVFMRRRDPSYCQSWYTYHVVPLSSPSLLQRTRALFLSSYIRTLGSGLGILPTFIFSCPVFGKFL